MRNQRNLIWIGWSRLHGSCECINIMFALDSTDASQESASPTVAVHVCLQVAVHFYKSLYIYHHLYTTSRPT